MVSHRLPSLVWSISLANHSLKPVPLLPHVLPVHFVRKLQARCADPTFEDWLVSSYLVSAFALICNVEITASAVRSQRAQKNGAAGLCLQQCAQSLVAVAYSPGAVEGWLHSQPRSQTPWRSFDWHQDSVSPTQANLISAQLVSSVQLPWIFWMWILETDGGPSPVTI